LVGGKERERNNHKKEREMVAKQQGGVGGGRKTPDPLVSQANIRKPPYERKEGGRRREKKEADITNKGVKRIKIQETCNKIGSYGGEGGGRRVRWERERGPHATVEQGKKSKGSAVLFARIGSLDSAQT